MELSKARALEQKKLSLVKKVNYNLDPIQQAISDIDDAIGNREIIVKDPFEGWSDYDMKCLGDNY